MAFRPRVFGAKTKADKRATDQRRGSARDRGYDAAWDRESAAFLREHPVCEYCARGIFATKRVSPAGLVDHLYPHKGNRTVFWLRALWVASCVTCHSGAKQALERQGVAAIDALAKMLGRPTLSAAIAAEAGGVSKVW